MSPAANSAATSPPPLLAVRGLVKHFATRRMSWLSGPGPVVHAVNTVSFEIGRGETLALVGESGCGKTTLGRTLAGLYPPTAGSVALDGAEITGLSRRQMAPHRRRIQMIFQDPFASLNPRRPVSAILAEPLVIHRIGGRAERRARVEEAAARMSLEPAMLDRYPHQFAGGQRQRIAIARALILEPDLIVADEPLSALDVSLQSQMLQIFAGLKRELGIATLFISHDLAVVDAIADRVAVMYLGHIVEIAPRAALFARPAHPYTRALIAAVPVIDDAIARGGNRSRRRAGESAIAGDVPDPLAPPPGCPFHPRCPRAADICRSEPPEPAAPAGAAEGHLAACHFRDEVAAEEMPISAGPEAGERAEGNGGADPGGDGP